jgi:hypothetical protein
VTWQRINLNDPEYQQRSEPPDLLSLFYARKRHLVSGESEAAKTLLVLIAGLEHQRGGGTLFLLDFESGPVSTRQLLADLGASDDEIERVHYFEPDAPPEKADIDGIVARHNPFVVIDAAVGAFAVSGLDDNKRMDAERFGRTWIDPLYRHGVATVVIDHVTKNAESRGRFAIGTERKLSRVDVHLRVETAVPLSRGRRGVFRIVVHKDRGGWHPKAPQILAELELVSDPETQNIVWSVNQPEAKKSDSSKFRPTVLMERVSRFLEEQSAPVPRSAIETLSGKTPYLREARDCLIAEGYVQESPGPRGAKLLSSVKAFRDGDFAPSSPFDKGGEVAPEPALGLPHEQAETTTSPQVAPASPLTSESSSPPSGCSPTGEPLWRGEVKGVKA